LATSNDRVVALRVQLTRTHEALRQQLRAVRAEIDGAGALDLDTALITHCLGFCQALTAHHIGEDGGMFAALRDARPDLSSVIANLAEDHRLIASILRQVQALLDHAARADDDQRAAIGRELDGLAAIMESHFQYEERRIGEAINDLASDGWSRAVFQPW
jgi:hemerythrin-like domain-containing protein